MNPGFSELAPLLHGARTERSLLPLHRNKTNRDGAPGSVGGVAQTMVVVPNEELDWGPGAAAAKDKIAQLQLEAENSFDMSTGSSSPRLNMHGRLC